MNHSYAVGESCKAAVNRDCVAGESLFTQLVNRSRAAGESCNAALNRVEDTLTSDKVANNRTEGALTALKAL